MPRASTMHQVKEYTELSEDQHIICYPPRDIHGNSVRITGLVGESSFDGIFFKEATRTTFDVHGDVLRREFTAVPDEWYYVWSELESVWTE